MKTHYIVERHFTYYKSTVNNTKYKTYEEALDRVQENLARDPKAKYTIYKAVALVEPEPVPTQVTEYTDE